MRPAHALREAKLQQPIRRYELQYHLRTNDMQSILARSISNMPAYESSCKGARQRH